MVGLNWDFAPGSSKLDLDCSAVCFGNTGTLVDAAFYNQLSACNGAILHSGDCKDGRKEGNDETISIHFQQLIGVTAIVFLISAFGGGTLKDCESAFCEIKQGSKVSVYNNCESSLSHCTASHLLVQVLATVNLAGPAEVGAKTGVLMCMLFKHRDTGRWMDVVDGRCGWSLWMVVLLFIPSEQEN